MSTKTKKALKKRVKITASGKIMRRKTRQNHFNARQSNKARRQKRRKVEIAQSNQRMVKAYI